MGFLDTMLGSSSYKQQFQPRGAPLQGLTGDFKSRIRQVFTDPRSSQDFIARRDAIRNLGAVRRSDLRRRVDERFGERNFGGLGQGAREATERQGISQIGAQEGIAESQALGETIASADANFKQLLATLADFRSRQDQIAAGSIRQESEHGFLDFTGELINQGRGIVSMLGGPSAGILGTMNTKGQRSGGVWG